MPLWARGKTQPPTEIERQAASGGGNGGGSNGGGGNGGGSNGGGGNGGGSGSSVVS
ncbi:hypothetical protein [Paenarthrobacter sp. C1]|uniref:hypothetical protein n=1 Tax=Paenarthrobacter sp. C1 TaxID=3400220 RepID=UPI003BF5DE09